MKDLGQDRYGRTVGEVLLTDGRNLTHELVKAGLRECIAAIPMTSA